MHSAQGCGKAATTRRWVGDTADARGEQEFEAVLGQEPTATAARVAKKSNDRECYLSNRGPRRRHIPYVITYAYMSHMHIQQTHEHILSPMCCRDSCNRYYIDMEHMRKYTYTHDTHEIRDTYMNTCTQNIW